MSLHLDISLALGGYALNARADIALAGITALEGPSGSGKTTLLRAIAGLERRATGVIRFGEADWLGDSVFIPPQKRRIGYVFQDARLFKHLDVGQNLAYGHQRTGADHDVLERVIAALDLSAMLTRRIGGLSGGEQQRVAIGRALAMDPQLLLLDEPMSGLDQARKDEILPYITRAVQTTGCPAIYVSHERRETSMLADHIMRISDGQVIGPVPCETILAGEIRPAGKDGPLRIFVGGYETRVPIKGPAGTKVTLRICETGVLLTKQDPGINSAPLSLPATIASLTKGRGEMHRLVLEGAGWQVAISRTEAEIAHMNLQSGQSIWMTIAEAVAQLAPENP